MGLDDFVGGLEPDFIAYDELGNPAPRRELIAVSERTGRTVAISAPADFDLGEVLPEGYVVGVEAGA